MQEQEQQQQQPATPAKNAKQPEPMVTMKQKTIVALMVGSFMCGSYVTQFSNSRSSSSDTSSSSTSTELSSSSYSSPDSSLSSRDKVAADILAVACGNQVGLVAYDAIGGQLKELLEGDGINPEEVHSNWDYYYSRAKEMNDIKGYGCIK